jgi:hypothetical protein
MGGKALNKYGVFTERKNTEEFFRIAQDIQFRLGMELNLTSATVTCYRTKADHGDLDLLIKVPFGTNVNWVDYIRKAFQPQAVYANGGVYSFDYQGFQVDFIPIQESKWETALVYFSYDPLGNIMGKTYHKFGLSYGWEGLFYKFRNFNGSNSQDILLTNDARKIFDFGGYDYDRYLKGFDTLEDIFKFCIAGKFFDAEMFQMENLKSIDKKRNRKRGSYHLFLNYLKDNEINTKYAFNADKDYYLQFIEVFFPEANFSAQLEELKKQDALKKVIAQKFNGDIVMGWFPNLQGKELGAAMSKFKSAIGDGFDEFILQSDYETIHNNFIKIYNGKSE